MKIERQYFTTNAEILGELGLRLRSIRLAKNMPQEELARQAGVAIGSIQRLEAGKDVRLSSLIAMLRALDELAGIHSMVPEAEPSPLEIMDVGHPRKKAKRFKKRDSVQP